MPLMYALWQTSRRHPLYLHVARLRPLTLINDLKGDFIPFIKIAVTVPFDC